MPVSCSLGQLLQRGEREVRLLQPIPELEKSDHRGEFLTGVVCTLALFHFQRNAFEIHLPRRAPPLLQMLQTSGPKQGRLPGLVGKAKNDTVALDTSAMPLSE